MARAQLPLPTREDTDAQAIAALVTENQRLKTALQDIAFSNRTKTGLKQMAKDALFGSPVVAQEETH